MKRRNDKYRKYKAVYRAVFVEAELAAIGERIRRKEREGRLLL